MATSQFLKIFPDQIASLPNSDFLLFCDRLLNKIFPNEYNQSPALIENGYAIINNAIYSVIPDTSSIKPSIASLSALNKKPIAKLIVLAKSVLGDSQKLQRHFRTKLKNLSTEIWEPETIKQKVKDFTDEELYNMIGSDSNISTYFRISSDQKIAFSYYQDIFGEIFKKFKGPYRPAVIDSSKSEFAKILDKVPLNFSKAQNIVWDFYSNSYQFKNLAEKFIQEQYKNDSDFKNSLIGEIHSSFCTSANAPRHNYPVNDFQVIDNMAAKCLKAEYKEDPKLLNLARGIIMYFFELCEFGARNLEDQKEYLEPSLFK